MDTEPKTRIDAWEVALSEARRWQVYDRLRREPWYAVAEWAEAEFGVAKPSRAGMFRFASRMRALEAAHRRDEAARARAEITSLAEAAALPRSLVAGYQSLAAEAALAGDCQSAVSLTQAAMAIASQQSREAELALRAKAQETKDEQLRLAREKFEAAEARLAAAKGAVANTSLSSEEREARLKEIFGL
jgi:hypothetical protein